LYTRRALLFGEHPAGVRKVKRESDMASTPIHQEKTFSWKLIFRVVRWTTYGGGLIALALMLHKAPAPVINTNPQAAARVEQKFEQVEQAVSSGQPATMRMDQTELNSYLVSHLDIAPSPTMNSASSNGMASPSATTSSTPSPTSAPTSDSAAAAVPLPNGTSAEQIDQVRSAVKDVKVELIEDRARAYVVFDFHGKDMTLQLEGRLRAEDGYLRFEPVAGQLGSLPIPQSTLEAAVRRLMESPENREKLKLPDGMSSLKIENGEVVASYK
jgi:hypothetical protein